MHFRSVTLTVAALLCAPAAFAQTAPAAPTTPALPAAEPLVVTDAEIDQFIASARAVAAIQADASVAATDKNAKMKAAVAATGLAPRRFNVIATAMKADAALDARIQAAAAKQAPAKPN